MSGRTWSHDGRSNIGTGTADISFPVTSFLGMLAAPGGSPWAGRIWWKEALDRPEASSASDLLCDFESLLFSSLGLNFPICEMGEAALINLFHGPQASESLMFKTHLPDSFPDVLTFHELPVVSVYLSFGTHCPQEPKEFFLQVPSLNKLEICRVSFSPYNQV